MSTTKVKDAVQDEFRCTKRIVQVVQLNIDVLIQGIKNNIKLHYFKKLI